MLNLIRAALLCIMLIPVGIAAQEVAGAASPEGIGALTQVDFEILRVVAQEEFEASPELYRALDSRSVGGEVFRMPVEIDPLLLITSLDRAVIRRGEFGLHHLDLHLTEEDVLSFADLTEDQAGQRVLLVSRGNILLDLFLTGRDESGRFSLFYGDTALEQIENVLDVLQVPYSLETSPSEFIPQGEADELFLSAMQSLEMSNPDQAITLFARAITAGGEDYPLRPDAMMAMGTLFQRRGDVQLARPVFEELREKHPDFEDLTQVLMQLLQMAMNRNDRAEQIVLCREIVRSEASASRASITAQVLLVDLLTAVSDEPEVVERAGEILIAMLENRIATLPLPERFDPAYALVRTQVRLGHMDDAAQVVMQQINHWTIKPSEQCLRVILLCDLFTREGEKDAPLAILDHFEETLNSRDAEDGKEREVVLLQIQSIRERVEALSAEE